MNQTFSTDPYVLLAFAALINLFVYILIYRVVIPRKANETNEIDEIDKDAEIDSLRIEIARLKRDESIRKGLEVEGLGT